MFDKVITVALVIAAVVFGVRYLVRRLERATESSAEGPSATIGKPDARSAWVQPRVPDPQATGPSTRALSNADKVALMTYARSTAVVVEGWPSSGNQGQAGSGFVIKRAGPYAIVATNRHVVLEDGGEGKPLAKFQVRTASGGRGDASLLYFESESAMDFALLAVRDERYALGQEVEIADEATVGEYVVCVGSPLQSGLATFEGHVTEVLAQEGAVVADCVSERGSSGGPIFDAENRVVGITAMLLLSGRAGTEQTIGLLLGRYMRELSIHRTTVAANRDWQDSTILVGASDQVQVLATGIWDCGFFCGGAPPGGTSGNAEYSYDRRFPHAALLVRVSGSQSTDCVCKQWSGGMDRWSAVAFFTAVQSGTLSFRSNDNDYGNNSGYLDVLVVVKGPGT